MPGRRPACIQSRSWPTVRPATRGSTWTPCSCCPDPLRVRERPAGYTGSVVSWLPNLLTGARLVAVVPFAILLAHADNGVSTSAAILFALIASTDFLDGYLARHLGAQTRFG